LFGRRLTFEVIFIRTVNLGPFTSMKVGLKKEHYQDEKTIDDAFRDIQIEVDKRVSKIAPEEPPKEE
jgi:hypothetical protein